jgi:heat shock protein 4
MYGKFISAEARESFNTELQKMEDWLYDTFDATKLMYLDKLDELKTIGDPVVWRFKENERRPDWVEALRGTIKNYRKAAEEPGDNYGHIDAEKLKKVVDHCQEASAWLEDLVAQQEKLPHYQKPVVLSAEVEKRNQEVAKFCDKILREPKPAPKDEPKLSAAEVQAAKLRGEKPGKKAKKAKVQPAAAAEDDEAVEAAEAEAKENGTEAPEAEVEADAPAEEPAKSPPTEAESKDAAEDTDMVD